MSRTTEQWIELAKSVHGNDYDYSKTDLNDRDEKGRVCIICNKCGLEFRQRLKAHVHNKQGCPKCGGSMRLTNDDFIEKSHKIHGENYDYSHVNYINSHTKVTIICKKCGQEFKQTPNSHLNGNGCPHCRGHKISVAKTSTRENFIDKSKIVHCDEDYIYNYVEYKSAKDEICVVCRKHGKFWQTPDKHLRGHGCPSCGVKVSNPEIELKNFLQAYIGESDIKLHDKDLIKPLELDLYIPSKKIAIEYNGLRWHSELFNKGRNYHLDKLEKCLKNGVKLVQIFEDEYFLHKDIVLSKIKNIIKCNDAKKVFARKCTIKEIANHVAKDFLNINHIQGFSPSSVYVGAFYGDLMAGVMSFKKENKDCNNWELTRFATDINYHCVGVGGKLFIYFIRNYNPNKVKSFADRRWTIDKDNNLYTKLGFKLDSILPPDYRYYKNGTIERIHKFNYRKQRLLKEYNDCDLNKAMTEKQMCDKLGFYRVWDCGLLKYEWIR